MRWFYFSRSDAYPELCIDFMNKYDKPIQLYQCHDDLKDPSFTQYFMLTWHKKLRM